MTDGLVLPSDLASLGAVVVASVVMELCDHRYCPRYRLRHHCLKQWCVETDDADVHLCFCWCRCSHWLVLLHLLHAVQVFVSSSTTDSVVQSLLVLASIPSFDHKQMQLYGLDQR